MNKTFVKSKIHRATVTDADLKYNGSITIDEALLSASGIQPYELVHINNLSNAAHWETYVIPGTAGQIVLNGPPSRLFQKGDLVVILGMISLALGEQCEHRTVFVNDQNQVVSIYTSAIKF